MICTARSVSFIAALLTLSVTPQPWLMEMQSIVVSTFAGRDDCRTCRYPPPAMAADVGNRPREGKYSRTCSQLGGEAASVSPRGSLIPTRATGPPVGLARTQRPRAGVCARNRTARRGAVRAANTACCNTLEPNLAVLLRVTRYRAREAREGRPSLAAPLTHARMILRGYRLEQSCQRKN